MTAKYVLFEGIDGAGKSELVKCVGNYMRTIHGQNVLVTREPGSDADPVCTDIRKILKSGHAIAREAEVFLFMADRAQHNSEVVQKALKDGQIVLQDRGFLSTYAYQGFGRGWDLSQLAALNKMSAGRPDLIVWVNTDIHCAWERIRSRAKDQFEARKFQEQVYDGFIDAWDIAHGIFIADDGCSPFPWDVPTMIQVNGSRNMQANVEEVAKAIMSHDS
jgi:dTMP kinase